MNFIYLGKTSFSITDRLGILKFFNPENDKKIKRQTWFLNYIGYDDCIKLEISQFNTNVKNSLNDYKWELYPKTTITCNFLFSSTSQHN